MDELLLGLLSGLVGALLVIFVEKIFPWCCKKYDIHELEDHLQEETSENKTVAVLANELNYSPRYLMELCFKSKKNCTKRHQ